DMYGKNNLHDSKTGKDSMTGLLNGTSFCAEMKKSIEHNPDKNFAVIIFDIERFKSINEVYGVRFGDSAIKYIANNLYEVFDSENCLTARFMSDFFGVLTPYHDDKSLEDIINRLNAKISMYKHVSLRYSYGVYVIGDKSIPARLICDYANMAKNSIKGNHINHIAFYTDGMKDKIIEEINIENDMEKALEEEQFVMYLQPKYHIRDDKVVGAEALARWNHPVKGFIKPAKFIPLFEKNGFIIHLDQYIWEQACRYIKKWCNLGIEPVPISVNVSRVNLKNPKLVDILDGLIEKYKIDKKYLELEITETVYYDDQHALENILEKLKKSGYTLLMDDFGSGFSSLSMLKNTPFDVLKIDRNFLNETMITDRGKKIIQHTICLSNDIGMNTVAEGVETKEQADYLLKCGCCIAQGYYYSKPVPTEDFEKMLGL
ncbi:MAG: EAL domain-containing protein, partial [Oscillospiraceae bacterium]|nr:EAL domain-containing protein [Oscillospiraceae bacterium]